MKLGLIYFILCTIIKSIQGPDDGESSQTKKHSVITLIYNPEENLYSFVDAKTIKKISSRPKFPPNYSHVAFYCASQRNEDIEPKQKLELIRIAERNEEIENIDLCDHQYRPKILSNGVIGYYFRDEDLQKFQSKGLPPFPNTRTNKGSLFHQVISITTDESKLQTTQATYTFTSYKHFLAAKKRPTLLRVFDEDIMEYYISSNQAEVLKNLKYSPNDEFVAHPLIPVDDFIDTISKQATRVDLNTVPLWKSVAKLMKAIQNFIRYIAQHVNANTLTVITSPRGNLELSHTDDPNSKKLIYLAENRLPVPKILVKILRYKVPIYNLTEQFRYYFIAIVIHNESSTEIEIPEDEKLCQINLCEGNTILKIDSNHYRNIFYCCDLRDRKIASIFQPTDSFEFLDFQNMPAKVNVRGEVMETVEIPPLH